MNPSKNSLAYDLQEPFRFLVDLSVIKLIESKKMDDKDLIRNEIYSLRLKPSGAQKVTEEFNNWMNKKVAYKKQSVM
jgi:CRISPR-associated protein Cas1